MMESVDANEDAAVADLHQSSGAAGTLEDAIWGTSDTYQHEQAEQMGEVMSNLKQLHGERIAAKRKASVLEGRAMEHMKNHSDEANKEDMELLAAHMEMELEMGILHSNNKVSHAYLS
ncbi:hypothetical protein AB1Y20_012954 [Prymnesium parvum]|uniref:Uncharacterized protein n=1 Tax=Prymnesium parvum TaxID=97485 RepID=A0AB34IKS9_PRYPA